ncbi:MAG: HAMP domain-containing protein [Acidobacteriota bacterium]|nr:HAMP domain-containing protein [Acidobacteriota bacterium]
MGLPRLAPAAWPRLPRRTARLRLTALYGGLVLLFGVALLASTYVLFEHATAYKPPHLPTVPRAPTLHNIPTRLLFPGGGPGFAAALPQLQVVERRLKAQRPMRPGQLALRQQRLLTKDQHQLAQAVHQLARAVHKLAQTGPVEAAQRAADSHQLLVNSAIALGIVAVLAVLVGWLVAGRMLRPIRTITRTARRISSTSLHERLALAGPDDELKELGDTLDGLFARLEEAFEAQRRFVANASHELRTPLTAERTLLQVALDDPETSSAEWRATAAKVLASNTQHARLIDALLALASSETGVNGHAAVDLSASVAAALSELQAEVDQHAVEIRVRADPAPVAGDEVLVQRLVANLLINAVRYNSVGGLVEVATGSTNGRAMLTVTNTGPVIPAIEVTRLLQPFQRRDPRRAHHGDGHGLGLAIVKAIADAHHATLVARPRPQGGLTVEVSFPIAVDGAAEVRSVQ